jgi:alkanesulfonate monooxygenase SsuD/methylene tetrahydromethanopterin reductase-like flavin-dependent oxidoreductase (luciferase family)
MIDNRLSQYWERAGVKAPPEDVPVTATTNPLRFGVNIRRPTFPEILELAQVAEEAGFDTVTFSDRPPERNLEAWTLATAIGALTQRLILTHSTLNVPFRNPALLAKMAASLDSITGGGRVELTLGAGGQESHFHAYGIELGAPAERFRRLRETVTVLRGIWQNPPFTYRGRLVQVEGAEAPPAPVRGTIPIWIGAGRPQMLAYTGRAADGWLKNGGWPASLEELRDMVGLLEEGAQEAGRDPRTIRRALNGAALFAQSRDEAEWALAANPGGNRGGGGLLGTAEDMIETIRTYFDSGIDTFHLQFVAENAAEQMRRFGREVMPRARELAITAWSSVD